MSRRRHNHEVAERVLPAAGQELATLPDRKVVDTFDRSQMPAAAEPVQIRVPPLWQDTLGDNIQLLGTVNDEIPAVSVILALPGGQRAESPADIGLATLTAAMMNQGSQRLKAGAFSEALERLGASISVSGMGYSTSPRCNTERR